MKKEFVIKFNVYQNTDDPKISVRIAKGQCVNQSNTYKEALIKTLLYVVKEFEIAGKRNLLNDCDILVDDDSTVNGAYIQYQHAISLICSDEFLRSHYFSALSRAVKFDA